MKCLRSAEIKNINDKLVIFKNHQIKKIELMIGLKKIMMIIIVILNTEVLRTLDICLMKRIFIMVLMILNICLMKMKTK